MFKVTTTGSWGGGLVRARLVCLDFPSRNLDQLIASSSYPRALSYKYIIKPTALSQTIWSAEN